MFLKTCHRWKRAGNLVKTLSKEGMIAWESSEISAMIPFWKERTLLWKGTMKTRSKLRKAELLGTLKSHTKPLKCGSSFPRDKGCKEIWETEALLNQALKSRGQVISQRVHIRSSSLATESSTSPTFQPLLQGTKHYYKQWTQTCKTLKERKV